MGFKVGKGGDHVKYVLIIPDGCADEPQQSLDGQTPLQAARLPHMDAIALAGVVGQADNTPPALPSGSDVATMSLFGYDPLRFHTGRAPIEAAAQGITLSPTDWCIRCNFVTVANGVMQSFTAGQIPNDIGASLIADLQRSLGSPTCEFFPGVSYRNLIVLRPGDGPVPFDTSTRTTPPHDITDQPIAPHLPGGLGGDFLRDLMERSEPILAANASNHARGEQAASQIWLWGQGRRPALEPFASRFAKRGAMITAVDLLRGLANLLGWTNIRVPGATGYLDTDYAAKGRYAIEALRDHDLVVVHVEATDEASHEGSAHHKIEALERIDADIVGPVHAALKGHGDYRILVSPDHPTFVRTKTHSYGFVPFALCGSGITAGQQTTYDELAAAASGHRFPAGHELMARFLSGPWNG
jgi:2,3-bisphosphoglycerate-independent phosphoglycerate mutase